eukprot:7985688-Ditylum_brightwellii.AAC.1
MDDEVFIGLDANAGLNNSKFAKIVHSKNLHDVIITKHGPHTPPTYNRQKTTLNHIIVSPCLPSTFAQCGTMPSNKYFLSDHNGKQKERVHNKSKYM